jgi:hypothetical protein
MHRKAIVPALFIGIALISGCGQSKDQAAPQVASVAGDTSATAGSSAAPAAHGPQIRPDTTEEESAAWTQTYMRCLRDNGATVAVATGGKGPAGLLYVDGDPPAAAAAACVSKKPVQAPELDPAQNPDYKKQWHEQVKCMQDKGMPIIETGDGWTYNSENAKVPANEKQIDFECQVQAFTKK